VVADFVNTLRFEYTQPDPLNSKGSLRDLDPEQSLSVQLENLILNSGATPVFKYLRNFSKYCKPG